jgi:PKD repeat protein
MRKSIICILFLCYFINISVGQVNTGITPVNNTTTQDTIISFEWNKDYTKGSGVNYQLQIAQQTNFSVLFSDISGIIPTNYTVNFNANHGTYYWRIRSFNGSYSNWSSIKSFRIFNPNNISSVGLWLDADTGIFFESNKVREWHDLSPYNNDLYQYDTNLQLEWNDSVINNQPCVHFTSALDYLNFTDTIDTLGGTLFTVLKNTNVNGSYFVGFTNYINGPGLFVNEDISQFWFYGNRRSIVNYSTYSDFALISVKQDTTTYGAYQFSYFSSIKFNQDQGDSLSSYGYNFAMNWLGTTNWYGGKKQCDGDMAELIYYYAPLNDSLYELNEQYLRHKYAPAVNLGVDIIIQHGFCDTVLDAGARFTDYLWSTGETTQTITVSQNGQYSVTATGIFGFQSADSTFVFFPGQYNKSDTTICYGDTITIYPNIDTAYSFIWSDTSTDTIFKVSSAGKYWVDIYDTIGCFMTDTFMVNIDSFTLTTSLGSDTSVCQGNYIVLINGFSEAQNYLWDTGETDSLKYIDTAGTYSLIVTNINGCIAYDTINVNVSGLVPNTGFIADSSCYGTNTVFTDTSNIVLPWNIVSWDWDFGDTNTSILQNPQHQYSNYGNYIVDLIVVTDSGCIGSFTDTIYVIEPPSARFSPINGCTRKNILFSNQSSTSIGNINQWHWDFNDSWATVDTSILETPSHIFDSIGIYPIELIVTTNNGCSDTLSQDINIKKTPEADFSLQNVCAHAPVYFSDETQTEAWENIMTWQWTLGNGNSSNYSNPYQTYDTAGTYPVTLIVQSLNGCWDTVTKTIEIFPLPSAYFTANNACATQGVSFLDSSTIGQGNISLWEWTFSDIGQTSNLQNPIMTYIDTGYHNVKLVVTSDSGCVDYYSKDVRVYPIPIADYKLSPEYGIPPLEVEFTNFSINATDFTWDFGDGTILSSIIDPTYFYLDTGLFQSCLIAENQYFCYDTLCKTVFVIPSYFDIAVNSVEITDTSNNQIEIRCELLNIGSRKINQLFLKGQLGNNAPIVEHWNGELLPGEQTSYVFNAHFYLSSNAVSDYICVTAQVVGELADNNSSNDRACTSISNNFLVGEIYPNPSHNHIYIPIVIPESDELNINIYNTQGQIVAEIYNEKIAAGFVNIKFDMESLLNGVYYIVSQYQNKEDIKKLIVY